MTEYLSGRITRYPWQKPYRGTQLNRTHPMSRGLVGAFPFNENGGERIYNMSQVGGASWMSAQPAALFYGGASWGVGVRGSAAQLVKASEEYISIPPIVLGARTGSFFILFSPDSFPTTNTYDCLLSRDYGEASLYLHTDIGDQFFIYGQGCGTQISFQDPALTIGDWHFAGITCDDTTVRLYLDGVEVVNGGTTADWDGEDQHYLIGCWGQEAVDGWVEVQDHFNGMIGLVLFYNRCLSVEEIIMLGNDPYVMFR